jgi:hypothetical protein
MVDLKVGDKFILNEQEHLRIADERISCCKVLNAQNTATGEKVQVVPITEVQLVSQT